VFCLWTPPRRFLFHRPLFLTRLHVPTTSFLIPFDCRLLPAYAPTRVQVITAHPRHSRFLSCRSHLPEESETAMTEALASTRADPISWRSWRRRWRKHWRVHGSSTTTTAAVAFLTVMATPTFDGGSMEHEARSTRIVKPDLPQSSLLPIRTAPDGGATLFAETVPATPATPDLSPQLPLEVPRPGLCPRWPLEGSSRTFQWFYSPHLIGTSLDKGLDAYFQGTH
jgi:hypothetical protein